MGQIPGRRETARHRQEQHEEARMCGKAKALTVFFAGYTASLAIATALHVVGSMLGVALLYGAAVLGTLAVAFSICAGRRAVAALVCTLVVGLVSFGGAYAAAVILMACLSQVSGRLVFAP